MTSSDAASVVFVDRETEFDTINKLLATGDVLVLGEAGIGKTSLINKVVGKIKEKDSKDTILFRINVTSAPYGGWLSQRIALMAYDQIKSDEKKFSKIKNWLVKYYPDLLNFIQVILSMEGKLTGQQIITTNALCLNSQVDRTNLPNNLNKAISSLLEQYTKEFGKNVYVIVEDTHELSMEDKKFLAELLSNHSSEIHIILSRRSQDESQSLYSSPEINYFMRAERIVYINGLDRTAVSTLFTQLGLNFDFKTVDKIMAFSKGNPYILKLLARLTEEDESKINSKILSNPDHRVFNIWNYVHSQFFEKFIEFGPILKASSILPSDIHAELIGKLLNRKDFQFIQNQLQELERRGILYKDEEMGFHFFHPLFAMYLYGQLAINYRKNMHRIVGLYYKALAKESPKPLYLVATQYHAEKAGDKELEFWVLQYFAEIFYYVGKIIESKEHSNKALNVALDLKDSRKEFHCLILQFGLSTKTKIENLDQKLLRLRYLATKVKLNERDKINALWAEANYFAGLGDPAKAINPIKKCRKMVKRLGDDQNYFLLVQYEASLLLDLREKEKARKLLIKCLAEFKKLGDEKGIMYVLGEMGNLEGMSNGEKALEYFGKCLEIARKRQDLSSIANSLHGVGVANLELGKHNQALKDFNECIEITEKLGDIKGLMQTYLELARLLILKQEFKKAKSLIEKARAIAKDSEHLEGNAWTELVTGEFFNAKGQLYEARQWFLDAGNRFNQLGIGDSAKYALNRANEILPLHVEEQIRKFTQIGTDGLTECERRINPFVGKTVRVVTNEGIWVNKSLTQMHRTYLGVVRKKKYLGKITQIDRLLGIGENEWWIEGCVIDECELPISNYLILPYT